MGKEQIVPVQVLVIRHRRIIFTSLVGFVEESQITQRFNDDVGGLRLGYLVLVL